MKRVVSIILLTGLFCLMCGISVQAADETLTGSGMPILITEVAAMPGISEDFGQLVEIYNNTKSELDLYDYEFDVTTSRDANLTVQMGASKFKGGFYATMSKGEIILKSGELAVLWLVIDPAQAKYTESDVRTLMGNIPEGTQVIRVDTTDNTVAYGDAPYIDRGAACYLMANLRGCYADGGNNAELAGAYVRIYGQSGQGKSQLYGDIGSQTQVRWQADLTATTSKVDSNVACAFGTLDSTQTDIITNVYIPEVETTPSEETTNAPETTAAPETTVPENTEAPETTKSSDSSPETGDSALVLLVIIAGVLMTAAVLRRCVCR